MVSKITLRTVAFFTAVLLVGTLTEPVHGQLQQGVIAYWQFEGDGEDQSGDFELDIVEPATFGPGLFGEALDLTGGDGWAERFVDDPEFNFSDEDFTVSIWVKYADLGGEQILVEKFGPGGGAPGWTLSKLGSNNLLVHRDADFINMSFQAVSGFQTNVWHHVVFRREDGIVHLFVDGADIHEEIVTDEVWTDSPNGLLVGKRNDGDGRGFYMNGWVDELAIYDRAISDDEVVCIYSEGNGQTLDGSCVEGLGPPRNPQATVDGETQITFTWDPPTPVQDRTVQGYNVYRTRPLPGEKLNGALLTETQFVATGLQKATNYCFVVRAFDDLDRDGSRSEEACGRTDGEREGGLQGYWRFDGSGADCSPNQRHLEIAPGDIGFEEGLLGDALFIPPGAFFEGPAPAYRPVDDPELNVGDGDLTVSIWVYYFDLGGEQILLEKFGPGNGAPGWTLSKLASNNLLVHRDADIVNGSFQAPSGFLPETWHHVVFRREADTVHFFVDGQFVHEEFLLPGEVWTDSPNGLLIGKRNDGDGRPFLMNGLVDELAIWNVALDDGEIDDLFNDGFGLSIEDGVDCQDVMPPNPPGNVAAEPGKDFVTVSWTAAPPVQGVTVVGYNVYRTSPGAGRVNTDPVNGLEFIAADLNCEAEYCFTVRAVGDDGLESQRPDPVCATTTCELPPAELLSYWPFDDDGTDCENEFHLEIATDDVGIFFDEGIIGDALGIQFPVLEGNELAPAYRPIDDPEFNFGMDDFTIQVWVNYNIVDGEQVLIEKWIGAGGPGFTLTKLGSQILHFTFGAAGQFNSPGPIAWEPGIWYHVVARRRGNVVETFVNTELQASGELTGAVPETFSPLIIGMRNKADNRGFITDGRIDEVAIWNGALSDADIAVLYNDGFGDSVKDGCVAEPNPNPPANVTATPGNREVTVSWEAPPPVAGVTVTGYDVFSTKPGQAQLNENPVTGTQFTADGFFGGIEHCFVVRTIADNGRTSGNSGEACATAEGPGPNFADGLLSYYTFDDDGSDCADGRDVEIAAGIFLEPGIVGEALSIVPGAVIGEPGPAYRFEDDPEFNFGGNDFTVQVWVNYFDLDGEQILLEDFGPGGGGPGWTFSKLGSNNLLVHRDPGGSFQAPSGFEPGTWHHVIFRRLGDAVHLFVDSAVIHEEALNPDEIWTDSPNGLLVGKRNDGDGRGFEMNGLLDELGIWSRALSAAEIGVLYNDGFGTQAPCDDTGCQPVAEICDDGVDNDCDGLVDGADTADCPVVVGVGPFLRGDCDGNGNFGGTPTEAIVLLNFSFRGGPAPPCAAACDAEANGSLGITDALRILRAAFLGVGMPDAPFPDCIASDLQSDLDLGCDNPFCLN